jgi:cyanate lyase
MIVILLFSSVLRLSHFARHARAVSVPRAPTVRAGEPADAHARTRANLLPRDKTVRACCGRARGDFLVCIVQTTAHVQRQRGALMKKSDAPEALLAAASYSKPMTRSDVTEMIVMARLKKGLTWAKLAKALGQSKEWTTAALLGQMQMTREQAEKSGKLLGLPADAVLLLQQVPYKGSLPTAVPTDPLIYRWYEIVNVYGTTIKELIHEEFGDGIMSAIDFKMDIVREPDPKGDRVNVTMSGKFLPYKTY